CSDDGKADPNAPDADSQSSADADVSASSGCGISASQATGEFVPFELDVGGQTRGYFVLLPDGYDPARAYPVVYQFHGCSTQAAKENNNVPVQNHSEEQAIHV